MTLTLMEGAINAVKNYLDENMAAKLDELDTEYDDGITLADIEAYYLAETLAVPKMPAIYVLGDRTEVEAEGPGYMKVAHYMSIAVLVTDPVNETLRKRLYRHIRAIIELLRDARSDSTLEGKAIVFDLCEFSPMYGRAGTFLQDARVEMHIAEIDTE